MANTSSHTRSNKKWSAEEDNILISSYKDNVKYETISSILQRSVDAVKCRLVKKYLYPNFIELVFRDPNGELRSEVLTTHYDNIVRRFSILYGMTEADLGRYIWYTDKDIKKIEETAASETSDDTDLSEASETSDDTDLSEGSEWSEGSEGSKWSEGSKDSDRSEGSEGSKWSEGSKDSDDNDDSFTKNMRNASKWKLKYYHLKYTNRLKTINDMLKKI